MAKPVFDWNDPLFLDQQLSDEERMVRDTARQFSRDVLLPRVIDDFREERFDPAVMQQMGQLGLLGPTLPAEYGGAGVNHVAYGLAAREIEAIDSGYRSAMSVCMSVPWHARTKAQKSAARSAVGSPLRVFAAATPSASTRRYPISTALP